MSIDLDQTCHHQKHTTGYNYMQARHAMSVGGTTTSPQHMGIMNNAVAGYLVHAHYYVVHCPNKHTELRRLKILASNQLELELYVGLLACYAVSHLCGCWTSSNNFPVIGEGNKPRVSLSGCMYCACTVV